MPLSPIEDIIEDMRQGKMIVLMDDEDRENEGDLIMPASQVTPEAINFMARYGRGLICLTLTEARCKQLQLPLMVSDTNDKHGTNFTVSIEAAEGVTTGISAADRAVTVQAAVAVNATPDDIVMPGHVFPLKAQPGGVLTRAGHTEAGCDLARLAGFEPSSVIVEILNEDGSMARRDDLERFVEEHDLKLGTVADLIRYRTEKEKTVERVADCDMPTEYGDFRLFSYLDSIDDKMHVAMVYGQPNMDEPVLVRVHVSSTLRDVLGARFDDGGMPLDVAMKYIAEQGAGVLVVLCHKEEQNALMHRIRNYQLRDKGVNFPEQQVNEDLRVYGLGAQILLDLGVHKMRVISAPKKLHGFSGFDLEIVEYVSIDDE